MDPDDLERRHTLLTAAHRYDDLRLRHTLIGSAGGGGDPDLHLPLHEALELLGLGEVLAREAAHGRQLVVRDARSAGASWSQTARATGVTEQSAWQAHTAWTARQVQAHRVRDHEGSTPEDAAAARDLAGTPD